MLGLGAGVLFSVASILARFGMRYRSRDDGLFMSILMNVIVLGAMTTAVELPEWDTAGVVALAAGGVLGTFGGRATNLRAVRIIGPSRANAFLTGGPLVTALVGWFVLGEGISLLSGLGGVTVLLGLLRIVRMRSDALAVTPRATRAEPEPIPLQVDRSLGYLLAALAPILFGLAFVVRKWGLNEYPSAIAGAAIGAVAGLGVSLIGDVAAGRIGRRLRENLRHAPWWFVAAGGATSLALVSQFLAFFLLPAWVVYLLQGTQVLWTLLLAAVLLRSEERIDRRLVGSVVLVAAGVAAITIQY